MCAIYSLPLTQTWPKQKIYSDLSLRWLSQPWARWLDSIPTSCLLSLCTATDIHPQTPSVSPSLLVLVLVTRMLKWPPPWLLCQQSLLTFTQYCYIKDQLQLARKSSSQTFRSVPLPIKKKNLLSLKFRASQHDPRVIFYHFPTQMFSTFSKQSLPFPYLLLCSVFLVLTCPYSSFFKTSHY